MTDARPKVLVIGSGGREHALVWKLSQSARRPELFALPGSSAIGESAQCIPGDPLDTASVVGACRRAAIDLVVVGPEAPLAEGLADTLHAVGIRCFGPGREAAKLESSKAYAKEFMKRHRIPTARFEVYDDPDKALDAAAELDLPFVVKADGLAAGKGVFVCHSRKTALDAIRQLMHERSLGVAGRRIVLEECLAGPEVTVLALCDGKVLRALPFSRDHKRLMDGDMGPNTGGMGALAPVPGIPAPVLERIEKEILVPVMRGLEQDRLRYHGVLYVGLMLTQDGPRVLEFNVRFGDPETQAVLPVLADDLLDLVDACVDGKLAAVTLAAPKRAAVGVVLASEGYPEKPGVGRRIMGLDDAARDVPDSVVFHSGTRKESGFWVTSGGRVLTVVGLGPTVEAAREKAYAAASRIEFDGMQFRRDIAAASAVGV